ncbi:zinc finger-containing ubiquitin peptidase 1-like isoform X2 [Artemia franciscana]|uniref:C2H2-type domain-containing protein n=2 Tax=Artemia franciscana TaxID=6661 RepID=A0AA88KZM0_ARTSF|nr:hypothetical protein QYM36_012150 [Artemia franciscana]KAK2710878.1 hypothetical protein QYM36_012150 [Artemia franciscana]KAK2710879.1 hypothetical protein QYM36_012150 [Artemia franciscana]KAK2710880.1 hypothetical protein QYM36_012150 [Artemia franciscana]
MKKNDTHKKNDENRGEYCQNREAKKPETIPTDSPLKRSVPCLNLNGLSNSPKRSKEATASSIYCPLCSFFSAEPDIVEQHINIFHFESPEVVIDDSDSEPVLACPICDRSFENVALLQLHVDSDHSSLFSDSSKEINVCPVCQLNNFRDSDQLAVHVEQHFSNVSPCTPVTPGNVDYFLAKEFQIYERKKQYERERKEFHALQNQYGMDNKGNYKIQSENNMAKAVELGTMSVAEYQEMKVAIGLSERLGIDDGHSCTKRICSVITSFNEKAKNNSTWVTYLANETSHFATTYGDTGWGCGYRNIQMLLTCLVSNPDYKSCVEGLCQVSRQDSQENWLFSSSHEGMDIPSVSRIQSFIEKAWKAGFDLPGQEQLGGILVNTRKWIGATEVATLFSYIGIKYRLMDFHQPTGEGKMHPVLFEWVFNYFAKSEAFKPCLYLQHQGHSRTIVGAEKSLKNGAIRLLVLDPGHSKERMEKIISQGSGGLKHIRRYLTSLQAQQYQIMVIDGVIDNDEEYQRSKNIRSTRIP